MKIERVRIRKLPDDAVVDYGSYDEVHNENNYPRSPTYLEPSEHLNTIFESRYNGDNESTISAYTQFQIKLNGEWYYAHSHDFEDVEINSIDQLKSACERGSLDKEQCDSVIEYIRTHAFSVWGIEDVQSQRESLTEEQCIEVLESLGNNHDANVGINWEVIDSVICDTFGYDDGEEDEDSEDEDDDS